MTAADEIIARAAQACAELDAAEQRYLARRETIARPAAPRDEQYVVPRLLGPAVRRW